MPVYFDHNATTPLDPRVLETMLPFLREQFGNPSSIHRLGRAARSAIDTAREQVADLLDAHPQEVVFTSGGTEANNLAIRGFAARCEPARMLLGATEHASVSNAAESLVADGWRVERVPVDGEGRIQGEALARLLAGPVALVSIMAANNETGVVQDIRAVAEKARAVGAVAHTDAVQAAGKIAVSFRASGVQLMSVSAHKINGPKGVGALIADKAVDLEPALYGGGQEQGRRSGTENVAGIVGFGAAAALAKAALADYAAATAQLRARLESSLRAIGGIEVFSARAERLPNTICFAAHGVDGETLLLQLDRAAFAASSGSACGSGRAEPNPVLLSMGVAAELARGSMRVSLGAGNTVAQVDAFVAALVQALHKLRPAVRRAMA
ncbi:MAG: cysteine desulfurase [Pseudomonadota bacterium]|nr:MAG: cysteine desulfurase [Pseudomonadota bacterium]